MPIFPDEWLLMYRTASMASRVGPAVITTRMPKRSFSVSADSTASSRAAGSCIRPRPFVPQARNPSAQSSTSIFFRPASVRSASCNASPLYILSFIAGAMITGLRMAASVVVSASSAMPAAILHITSWVAGATIIASAQSGREMCSVEWSLMAANTSL